MTEKKKPESSKAKWNIWLPGKPSFAMVGDMMTRAQAEAHAKGIWPNCRVE